MICYGKKWKEKWKVMVRYDKLFQELKTDKI